MEQDSFPLRQTQNITHNLHMDGLGTHGTGRERELALGFNDDDCRSKTKWWDWSHSTKYIVHEIELKS